MSWLTPLGLLGLIGIVALITIYLIKPNYQQKFISSTFVWKLSLKYRKKQIPINKVRNILLFICQILIITALALILTQPFIDNNRAPTYTEKIAIIDASASMRTENDGETRFERAVAEVKELSEQVFDDDGYMTVILAGKEAQFIAQRSGADIREDVYASLSDLVIPGAIQCTFGEADINGAISLSEKVLAQNPKAEVLLYTGTNYLVAGGNSAAVKVVDISDEGEWNAAILNVTATLEENYYSFSVDVACYAAKQNRAEEIRVYCDIYGANYEGRNISLNVPVYCNDSQTRTAVFNAETGASVYSYDYIFVHIDEADSFSYDNSCYLYGGTKPVIKVQYASSLANNFFSGELMALRDIMRNRWDIDIDEVHDNGEPATEGYDLYIFEHKMPDNLPTDGVVLLVNPDKSPNGLNLVLGDYMSGDFVLAGGAGHPILGTLFNSENITVSEYRRVVSHDGFEEIIYCGGDPVFLIQNTPTQKIGVLSFSLNMSNLPVLLEFPVLIYNFFEYFLPSTVTGHLFEIDDTVKLNARSTELFVNGPGTQQRFDTFPASMTLSVPGIYTLTQSLLSGDEIVENFYVKVPSSQSDLLREVELKTPYVEDNSREAIYDLLIWLAATAVALLFVEWWLQSREYF